MSNPFHKETVMKAIRLLLLSILLSPTVAFGAQVYGTLKLGDRAVEKGIKMAIVCGTANGVCETDDDGHYEAFVPKGKCTLKVYYGRQELLYTIYSYDDPVKYDFDIVRQSDGKYILKRK